MKATVVEISGYVPAFAALYMTGKNVDNRKLYEILDTIEACTTRFGFVDRENQSCVLTSDEEYARFNKYMDLLIKYGIQREHETLLDFIKISIFMEDLHRGAQDDYDAHAKRMDIIRSSTRANKKSTTNPEISDWYKGKVIPFFDLPSVGVELPEQFKFEGKTWVRTSWGYVREDLQNDPDVLRGLVSLDLACDNISTVSFRNLRHIYSLRRNGTHAAPELQQAIEQVREELRTKCPILGDMLGKVWVPSMEAYVEQNFAETATVNILRCAMRRELKDRLVDNEITMTSEQIQQALDTIMDSDHIWIVVNQLLDDAIEETIE